MRDSWTTFKKVFVRPQKHPSASTSPEPASSAAISSSPPPFPSLPPPTISTVNQPPPLSAHSDVTQDRLSYGAVSPLPGGEAPQQALTPEARERTIAVPAVQNVKQMLEKGWKTGSPRSQKKGGVEPGNDGEHSPSPTKGPKNVCAICLERQKIGRGQALFTAECGHVFHFHCITANVRHGHVACPLCRARWSEVPWMAPLGRTAMLPPQSHSLSSSSPLSGLPPPSFAALAIPPSPLSSLPLASHALPMFAPSDARKDGGGTDALASRRRFAVHLASTDEDLSGESEVMDESSGEHLPPPGPSSFPLDSGSYMIDHSMHNASNASAMFVEGDPTSAPWNPRGVSLDQTLVGGPFLRPSTAYPYDQPVFRPPPVEPAVYDDDEKVDTPETNLEEEVQLGEQALQLSICAEIGAVPFAEVRQSYTVLLTVRAPSTAMDALPLHSSSQLQRQMTTQMAQSSAAPTAPQPAGRAALDLVAVLDLSGSMAGKKLLLLRQAMHFVISLLGPQDRLAIVTFSNQASRVTRLQAMGEVGQKSAREAVSRLVASGGTNIAQGLLKGLRILEERTTLNPVAAIMFMSDGQDTATVSSSTVNNRKRGSAVEAEYRRLLPSRAIKTKNSRPIPVHTFGFGSDHDPRALHTISSHLGGVFSFIKEEVMIQDAFAQCLAGLLSVAVQDVKLSFVVGTTTVKIAQIHSGAYEQSLGHEGKDGAVRLGDLYADEERNILLEVWLSAFETDAEKAAFEAAVAADGGTKLLRARCSYSALPHFHQTIRTETKELLVAQKKVKKSRAERGVGHAGAVEQEEKEAEEEGEAKLVVERQRNRLRAAISITKASELAEQGDLPGAQKILETARANVAASGAAAAGDDLSVALSQELRDLQGRLATQKMYEEAGRAFMLSAKSSHESQRACARGDQGEAFSRGYQTPFMTDVLSLSRASTCFPSKPATPSAKPMLQVFNTLSSSPGPSSSSLPTSTSNLSQGSLATRPSTRLLQQSSALDEPPSSGASSTTAGLIVGSSPQGKEISKGGSQHLRPARPLLLSRISKSSELSPGSLKSPARSPAEEPDAKRRYPAFDALEVSA